MLNSTDNSRAAALGLMAGMCLFLFGAWLKTKTESEITKPVVNVESPASTNNFKLTCWVQGEESFSVETTEPIKSGMYTNEFFWGEFHYFPMPGEMCRVTESSAVRFR